MTYVLLNEAVSPEVGFYLLALPYVDAKALVSGGNARAGVGLDDEGRDVEYLRGPFRQRVPGECAVAGLGQAHDRHRSEEPFEVLDALIQFRKHLGLVHFVGEGQLGEHVDFAAAAPVECLEDLAHFNDTLGILLL